MEIVPFKKILFNIKKKNVAIMGHMGSGKSSFGKKIAHHFNIEHIDTDKEIAKFENTTINEIFSLKGSAYFRKIESEIVLDILDKKNIVISLGGGSILAKEVRKRIKKQSFSIFLDVKIDMLYKRLKNSKNRPLLKDANILTTLKQLDTKRRKHYLNADITIDNSYSLNKTFLTFKKIFSQLNG